MDNAKVQRTKNPLILIGLLLLGAIFGIIVQTILHELGHYGTAYAFDKEKVEEIVIFPGVIIKSLNPLNYEDTYQVGLVVYENDLFESYGTLKGSIILFDGFFMEFLLLFFVIYLMGGIDAQNIKVFHYLLGFYAGMFNITYSWWGDFSSFLEYTQTPLKEIILAFTAIIITAFYFYKLHGIFRIQKKILKKIS